MEAPALQYFPVQQPGQVLVVQVPPHPSSAPGHLAVQSGTHTHLSLLQVSPTAQVPQVLPQPSSPHSLPVHLGVQAVQSPLIQTCILARQSTQAVPVAPHSVFKLPATQPALAEQHPAQVLLLQPQMASGQNPESSGTSRRRSRAGALSGGAVLSATWAKSGGALSGSTHGALASAHPTRRMATRTAGRVVESDMELPPTSLEAGPSGDQSLDGRRAKDWTPTEAPVQRLVPAPGRSGGPL